VKKLTTEEIREKLQKQGVLPQKIGAMNVVLINICVVMKKQLYCLLAVPRVQSNSFEKNLEQN